MRHRAAGIALVVCTLPLSNPERAMGQDMVQLRRPSGEIGVDFGGVWVDRPRSRQLNFREWVELGLDGSVLDPRFLNLAFTLRPTREQRSAAGPLEAFEGNGDRLDLRASANLLPTRPVSLWGSWVRFSGSSPVSFGSQTEFEGAEWKAGLNVRLRYLPLQMSYQERFRDQRFFSPAQQAPFRQAEEIRTWRILAENSKTHLLVDRTTFDDLSGPADFTSLRGNARHHLRWGKGSRLISSFQYLKRTGVAASKRTSWREQVHLQHTWTISSDYNFGQLRVEVPGSETSSRFGAVSVSSKITPTLLVSVAGKAQSSRFGGGSQSYYRAGPSANYSAMLPFGARLSSSGSLEYERARQQPSEDGFVPVLDERHVIDASLRFLLDNTDVDTGSVVLTSVDETTVFQDGLDYQLSGLGALVEVFILPTGRIAQGDTVQVDYRFSIFPTERADAILASYGANLRVAGVDVYHRRSFRDQRDGGAPLGGAQTGAGSFQSLRNYDDRTTGIRLAVKTPVGVLSLQGEHKQRDADDFDATSTGVSGGLSFALRRNVRGGVSAHWSRGRGDGRETDNRSAKLGLDWAVTRSLQVKGTVAAWEWTEKGGRRQRFVGTGLEATWKVRQVDVQLRYDRGWWREEYEQTDEQLFIRVVRSF